MRLCARISTHDIATLDLTVSYEECEVPFDNLLACLGKAAGCQTELFSLFSESAVKTNGR